MAVIGGNGGLPPHNPNNGNLGGNVHQQVLGTLKVTKIQHSKTGGQKPVIPPLTLSISSAINPAPKSSREKILTALSQRSKKSSPPVSPRQAAGKIEQAEQTIQLLVEKQKTQMLQNAYDKAMIEKCFQVAFEEAPHLLTQEFATLVVHLGADRLREILDAAHQYQKTEIINFFTNFVTPLLPYGALYSEYLTAFQNQPVDDYTAYQQALQLQVDPLLAYAKALQEPVPQQQPDPFYTAYAQALQQPVPQPPAQPTPVVPKKAKPPNPLAAFVGQKKIKSSELKRLKLTPKEMTDAFEDLIIQLCEKKLLKTALKDFLLENKYNLLILARKLLKKELVCFTEQQISELIDFPDKLHLFSLNGYHEFDTCRQALQVQDEYGNPYFDKLIQFFIDDHYQVVMQDALQCLAHQRVEGAEHFLRAAQPVLLSANKNLLAEDFKQWMKKRHCFKIAVVYLESGLDPTPFRENVKKICEKGRGKELVDAGFKNYFPLTKHGNWDNGIVLPYDAGYFN